MLKGILRDFLPNLEDEEVNICWGIRDPTKGRPEPDEVFNFESIVRAFRECLIVYGNNTRDAAFEAWRQLGLDRSHLYGGINNPMTIELNFFRWLPGDVPLNSRTIGALASAIASMPSGGLPPLYFDYPGAFRRLYDHLPAEKRPAMPFEQVTINEALGWGTPDFWEVRGPGGIAMAKSASIPFNAAQGFGHLVIERNPVFAGTKLPMILSSVTGARAIDTKAMNLLLIALVSGEEKAKEFYVREAAFVSKEKKAKGEQPSFQEKNLGEYADAFVESTKVVAADMAAIFAYLPYHVPKGLQYLVGTFIKDGLPVGVYPFPSLRNVAPHAFIRMGKGWLGLG